MPNQRRAGPQSEIDDLFRLPLAEFTSSRNALVARYAKLGRTVDAHRVKSLTKPPATAWAVNQVYWQKPKAIEQLIAVTERVRKAQTSRSKNDDLRHLLDEKKKMTAALVERASAILTGAGHAATPDATRRVSATLEALAVWGSTKGGPEAGRLTTDLNPPGFDALAATMGGARIEPARVLAFRGPKAAEDPAAARARAREDVKAAEKSLRAARRAAERAQAALAKANARAAAIEKQKRDIDARYAAAKDEVREASNQATNAEQAVAGAERSLARIQARISTST